MSPQIRWGLFAILAAVTLENIRELLHSSSPFVLRMVSGRVIDIPHPDFAALNFEKTSLILSLQTGRIEVVRINQIESIERSEDAAGA